MVNRSANAAGFNVLWSSSDEGSLFAEADAFEFMDAVPENSIDCIWTDPPYLLSNDGTTCVAGKMVKVNKGDWDRSRGIELDHQFNRGWIEKCHRILKPSGTIWISGTVHVYLSVGMALLQTGFRILNDITWEKPNPPPNLGCRCFTHSTELLLWATKAAKGSKHRYTFNYDEMRRANAGRQMKTVWRIATPSREETDLGKHPTQKPVGLVSLCLRASTNAEDTIFDPFSGSGTTAVAALSLGRRFIGCERNKEYANLAVRRIQDTVRGLSQPRLLNHLDIAAASDDNDGTK